MFGKDVWQGVEIEGRLYGLKTLFIRNLREDVYEWTISVGTYLYPHVYFTIECIRDAVDKNNKAFSLIRELLKSNRAVTIEADVNEIDQIPIDIKQEAHIIYRINDSTAKKIFTGLKANDTISFDVLPYRSYQVTLKNMTYVTPDQYLNDSLVPDLEPEPNYDND